MNLILFKKVLFGLNKIIHSLSIHFNLINNKNQDSLLDKFKNKTCCVTCSRRSPSLKVLFGILEKLFIALVSTSTSLNIKIKIFYPVNLKTKYILLPIAKPHPLQKVSFGILKKSFIALVSV